MSRPHDLNLLVGAVGLSALGDWLALVPLALHLEETTSSGILVALLFVGIWSQAIVLAGPAGLLAGRLDPRRVLLVFSVAQAVVAVGLAFVSGTAAVLVRTLMHERVPRHLHGRAFAAYNGLRNGAEPVALLGGGLLVVAAGARWTLLAAGAVPAVAAGIALLLARRRLADPFPAEAAA